MRKVYVPARIEVDVNGKITPIQIQIGYGDEWLAEEWVDLEITESGRKVNIAVGGIGMRYMCMVDYMGIQREVAVFNEGMKWYVLAGDY